MSLKMASTAFVVALGLLAGPGAAQSDGLALLKIESGARPAGMGGAFASVSGSPDAAVYNPAAVAGVKDFTASLGHTSYWEDIRLETGHFAMGLSSRVYLHGGIRFAVLGDIEYRDDRPTELPLDEFDLHDVSFKGGLAVQVSDRIVLGAAAGWFIEKIESYRGSAFNVDLGIVAQPLDHLSAGAAVTNLGSEFTLWKSTGDESRPISLPTTYRAGASYRYDRFLGSADLVYLDEDAHLHVGTEASVHRLLQLRAGYMFGYDTKDFTAGASFTRRNLRVDYAFVPFQKDLGTSHMFNLTFSL